MAFFAAPLLQVFCVALRLRSVSTTAVFSAVRCRCGMFISACTLAAGLLRGIAPPSRFHNGSVYGSVSRDSVPLRYHALEGADRNGLSPPPSRIRYRPTCPRCLSRQPCPGTPSGRCRRKCRLPVTFLFRYVASPHSFGKGGEIPAFPYSFGRGRVKDVVYRPSSEVMRSGRRPVGP